MRQIKKQDKQTLDVQLISFEDAFNDLSGHISCSYDIMVHYLNSGAILQNIFFTYELDN